MDRSRYFDNAATTPLDSRVLEAMLPFLGDAFGNANSIHTWGLRAHDAVERAREQVARLIGAEDPSQIFFTSGATEANNWVLNAATQILMSPFEHSALREPAMKRGARILENQGETIVAPPSRQDTAEEALQRLVEHQGLEVTGEGTFNPAPEWTPQLLSVMAVNNEIGTIWEAGSYSDPDDLVHSDITQAAGKIPIDLKHLDYASFSAHKFCGPKGIGALYCKGAPPEPLILGGEQEGGYRGGTLNVPGIVGMGAAAEIAAKQQEEEYSRAAVFKEILIDGLNGLADTRFNGGSRTSPFIVSVSFRGLEGESIVIEMDRAGYAISAGAACSSRKLEPSHVLTALNLDPEWLRGTVRISFGRFNTVDTVADLVKKLRSTVENLRTI